MEVYFIDVETEEKKKITSSFSTYSSIDNKELTLIEYFKEKNYGLNSFSIYLVEHEEIPDLAIFIVEVHLDSGTVFSEQTQQIKFY